MKRSLLSLIGATVAGGLLAGTVWPEVDLPRAPKAIPGLEQTEISLNETTGDGTWKFLLDVPDSTKSGIPRPTAAWQDFDFTGWIGRDWRPIRVPGEPAMQGFDIKNNEEYYYRRTVTVPNDWAGKRVLLRFDGVYSNARVWVGSRHVRSHVGGFTTWDCDLTELVRPGEPFTLTVGVADIQGKDKGLWNPEGRPVKNPSNASEYAHHNIGGILRDVSLVALPQTYLADVETSTTLSADYRDAELTMTARTNPTGADATLRVEVLDGKTLLAGGEAALCGGETAKILLPVKAPRLWDAEHPNLYTLRATLLIGGRTVQINEERIGFRALTFGGRNGTDVNKLYVNGRPVRLRGTCRHDVSHDLGRSMTREQAFAEARAYKEANINFIRTSHYPASEDLLDACDELGIYVEQEAAVCFQGPWAPVDSVYADYAAQFVEMVERDRNRACIVIWSIANESHFDNVGKKLIRNPFADARAYLREREPSRPVMFSWPNTGAPKGFFDIYSEHYAHVMGNMGRKDMPRLHDEYAHIACYNLDELRRDPNVRNFWGESVFHAWDHIVRDDGALGGALWGGIDDAFYLPANVPERHQRHSDGAVAGYGEWGSVWDAYHRPKPELWLTKKAYSPLRLFEREAKLEGTRLTVPVENRYDHTCLSELEAIVTPHGASPTRVRLAPLAPRSKGTFVFDVPAGTESVRLRFLERNGHVVEEAELTFAPFQPKALPEPTTAPTITETAETFAVKMSEGEAIFDRATARLRSYTAQGKSLLLGGPDLVATGVTLGTWKGTMCSAKTEGNRVLVTLEGTYACGLNVRFEIAFLNDGRMETHYTLLSEPPKGAKPREVGLSWPIPSADSVQWERTAFHSAYPEDQIGRPKGTALRVRPGSGKTPDRYGVRPAWPWKDDMRNYFVFAQNDPNDGLATNDFKAMREAIRFYTVALSGGGTLRVDSDGKSQAARVSVSAERMMIDDRDPRVRYSEDGWAPYDSGADYAGTETYSTRRGAWLELPFEGTGIRVIGAKQRNVGLARILVDGREVATIDTHSDLGNELKQSVIHTVEGLPMGRHTLRMETVGGHADCIVADAFEVLTQTGPRLRTQLVVCDGWWYPNLAWGNYTGKAPTLSKRTTGTIRLHPRP